MKTSNDRFRFAALAGYGLATLFLATAGTNVLAAPHTETRSVKIQYNMLDLATEGGTTRLYRRIKGAARRVCQDSTAPWDARSSRHFSQCYQAALAKAVSDVNNNKLTALYQRDEPKAKRVG
jgi:UrcA family protein